MRLEAKAESDSSGVSATVQIVDISKSSIRLLKVLIWFSDGTRT
jgi:hypothetical protein